MCQSSGIQLYIHVRHRHVQLEADVDRIGLLSFDAYHSSDCGCSPRIRPPGGAPIPICVKMFRYRVRQMHVKRFVSGLPDFDAHRKCSPGADLIQEYLEHSAYAL